MGKTGFAALTLTLRAVPCRSSKQLSCVRCDSQVSEYYLNYTKDEIRKSTTNSKVTLIGVTAMFWRCGRARTSPRICTEDRWRIEISRTPYSSGIHSGGDSGGDDAICDRPRPILIHLLMRKRRRFRRARTTLCCTGYVLHARGRCDQASEVIPTASNFNITKTSSTRTGPL